MIQDQVHAPQVVLINEGALWFMLFFDAALSEQFSLSTNSVARLFMFRQMENTLARPRGERRDQRDAYIALGSAREDRCS
jgi:hypothetical protein